MFLVMMRYKLNMQMQVSLNTPFFVAIEKKASEREGIHNVRTPNNPFPLIKKLLANEWEKDKKETGCPFF